MEAKFSTRIFLLSPLTRPRSLNRGFLYQAIKCRNKKAGVFNTGFLAMQHVAAQYYCSLASDSACQVDETKENPEQSNHQPGHCFL
jgi:hypothetical protein